MAGTMNSILDSPAEGAADFEVQRFSRFAAQTSFFFDFKQDNSVIYKLTN
jgi:hypothetical protein